MFNQFIINCDAALPWQLGFQDSASPSFDGLVLLHDAVMFYMVIVATLVTWMLTVIIGKFTGKNISHKYRTHGSLIEVVWTITPALILIAIAFPSFRLLYVMDEVVSPSLTIKADGNQWFWSIEYSDLVSEQGEPVEFDSYMKPEEDLELGELRCLEVDNRIVVPTDTHIRFIVSARDVIHDFAVPSLALKIDAVPGRLSQTSVLIERPGVFYGQCSELCGVYHGFMPIVIEAVSLEKYVEWLDSMQ